MKRIVAVVAAGLCACLVQAELFWISYDASCGLYPEEVGWGRIAHGGGAVRSLADGILTLDSTADSMICDGYGIYRPTTPGPGETFVCEWRMCLAQHSGFGESLVSMRADDGGGVNFRYWMGHLQSEQGWTVPIAPDIFHTYRLESTDMYTYLLWLDGVYMGSDAFDRPGPPVPYAAFGDCTYGTTPQSSLTQWEYFRFGVVPEPNSLALVLALTTCACVARRGKQLLVPGECARRLRRAPAASPHRFRLCASLSNPATGHQSVTILQF